MSLLCTLLGHRSSLVYATERRFVICERCWHVADDGPVLRPEQIYEAQRRADRAAAAVASQAAHEARIVEERDRRAESMPMPVLPVRAVARPTRKGLRLVGDVGRR